MPLGTYLPYLLIMAAVTYLVRALPYVLMKKKIENRFVKSFMAYLPYAVLAAMTFPAILYATSFLWSAIAGLAAAVVAAYFERGLFTVALSACFAALLAEVLIRYIIIT